jgi:hypothetical protein
MNAVGRVVGRPSLPVGGRLGEHGDHLGAVREADPVLAPGDRPAALDALGARDDVLRVAPRLGLGERVGGVDAPARHVGEVARLLLLGAEEHERLAAEPRVHAHHHA